MTCIIGLIEKDKIYMGGDSAGISNNNISYRKDHKIFINDRFIIGYTYSFRMGQLLRYAKLLELDHPAGMDELEFMVTLFIPYIIKLFKENGFARQQEGKEIGGQFLVGFNKRLFCIDSDYQVAESLDEFQCIGSGAFYATGAMNILNDFEITPINKIHNALQTSAKYSTSVERPFNIIEL